MTTRRLHHAVEDGEDAVLEYVRDEVLFTAFEDHDVEYYGTDDVHYETDTVMPSRFEEHLGYTLRPRMMGYRIRVASQYADRARVVDESRSTPRPLGSADTRPVLVLFRADASVAGSCSLVENASVFIVGDPVADDEP